MILGVIRRTAFRGVHFSGLALLVAGAVLACASNPVTRRPDVVLVSEAEEIRRGDDGAVVVAEEMGLVSDPRFSALATEVGRRVVSKAPERAHGYAFEVVDLPEPNAFALPGGHIYVSRGLLVLVNSEDELANVLSHEVVHVAGRHHAQRHTRAAGVGLLILPGRLVGGLIGGPVGRLVSAPFTAVGVGALASYSRGQELEADDYGQRLAADAGYDPGALATFLRTLEREEQLAADAADEPGWLDTHPSIPRRVAAAEKRAGSLTPDAPLAPRDRAVFLRRFDGLVIGEDPAAGLFEGPRFLHPDLDFTLVFPEGWETSNTRLAVGAAAPDGKAEVVLRYQGQGTDAREAANGFLAETAKHARLEVARLDAIDLNGRAAVHAIVVLRAPTGVATLDLTWIVHGGAVYLLTGAVEKRYTDSHRALFAAVAESFASLDANQRAGIRETRLRLRTAHAGESLAAFGRRTASAWAPRELAAANGLPEDAVLREGELLKVAISQPYRPGVQ